MQEKLLTFPSHMKMLIKQIVGNHPVANGRLTTLYLLPTLYVINKDINITRTGQNPFVIFPNNNVFEMSSKT